MAPSADRKKPAQILTLLLLLFAGSLACARTASTPAAAEEPRAVNVDGSERHYLLHVPSSHDDSQPVPLVLDFHGGGGNPSTQMRTSQFGALAEEKGFIVAYPYGTGKLEDKFLTWNGGACCGYAVETQVDDVRFVRALVAEIEAQYNIDRKRIYATGLSNGGIMAFRLACDAADVFAAVAPVAGTLNYPRCNPSEPVSIIEFHGTADGHINYNGGAGPDSLVDLPFNSVNDSIAFWLKANQCDLTPQTETFSDIQHDTYLCMQGTAVELYTIIGGKHAWPGSEGPAWRGGDKPTQSISATDLIWEFFAAHPKQ